MFTSCKEVTKIEDMNVYQTTYLPPIHSKLCDRAGIGTKVKKERHTFKSCVGKYICHSINVAIKLVKLGAFV